MSCENTLFANEFMNKSIELFEKAEKVADNDEIIHRVELASLGVLYMKCIRTPVLAREDGTYAMFSRIVEREKVSNWMDTYFLLKLIFKKKIMWLKFIYSRKFISSSVRLISADFGFSSKWFKEEVPGIGKIHGERCNSQAIFIWDSEAAYFRAIVFCPAVIFSK